MAEHLTPSDDFSAIVDDFVRRLRAVEREQLLGGDDDFLTPLQTFEDGSPLGNTLGINFGAGLSAVLVENQTIEVETDSYFELFEARRTTPNAAQTVGSGTPTLLTFASAVLQTSESPLTEASTVSLDGRFATWDSATNTDVVLPVEHLLTFEIYVAFGFASETDGVVNYLLETGFDGVFGGRSLRWKSYRRQQNRQLTVAIRQPAGRVCQARITHDAGVDMSVTVAAIRVSGYTDIGRGSAGSGSSDGISVEDEGVSQGVATTVNFVGAGVTSSVTSGEALVTIPGGGHVIEDEGTPLTQRADMSFEGAGVTAADVGGKTVVTIPGGSATFDSPVASLFDDVGADGVDTDAARADHVHDRDNDARLHYVGIN